MSDLAHAAHNRLTIRGVLADTFREVLALDSPVLRAMRDLTLRPGQFVRGYVDGERAGVVGPVKYLLLVITLLVLFGQLRRAFFPPEPIPESDPVWLEAYYAAHDLRTYVLLFVLFPTALVQRIAFWRRRFNLAESYAFLAYVIGHMIWLALLGSLLPEAMSIWMPLRILLAVLPSAYVVWATCDFYGSRALSVIARGLLVYAAYIVGMQVALQTLIIWHMGT